MARPTKYNKKIHDDLVYKLARDNKTNDEIADFLGVHRDTIYHWKNVHPSFSDALKKGADAKLDRVEKNLYERAAGIEYKEIKKTIMTDKNGKPNGKAQVTETTRFIPPDVGAACFLLKTQRPDKYRERTEIDLADNQLSINIQPAKAGDCE